MARVQARDPKAAKAAAPPPVMAGVPDAGGAMAYWTDSWQRSVLFWDVLRERGNAFLEHEKAGKPLVMAFEWEVVVDGAGLPRPVNYSLVHIQPPKGTKPDPAKRPVV